jgi:hypothetical protein
MELLRTYVASHEELKPRYIAALKRQAVIDEAKAKGEKIPLELVDNPFLKKYYRETGKGI